MLFQIIRRSPGITRWKSQACEILSGGGQFTVSGVVKELPESDDHNFYLFELETYEDARGK